MKFIEGYWDPGLFDEEPRTVSSVGVLVHTGALNPLDDPSFLLIEKVSEKETGWSIPAGHVEQDEVHPIETAIRELKEETGLIVSPEELELFGVVAKKDNEDVIRVVYSHNCRLTKIFGLANFVLKEGIWVTEGQPISDEVARLALVPRDMMYYRGHPIVSSFLRWDVMHDIKAKLEGLRVI